MRSLLSLGLFVLVLWGSVPAQASVWVGHQDLPLGNVFSTSGGDKVGSIVCYGMASFACLSDTSVQLTLQGLPDLGSGKITSFYFNFQPGTAADLTFVRTSGVAQSAIHLGLNAYKADGDGSYDIKIDFPESGAVLTSGSKAVFDIHRTTGGSLSINDFNDVSVAADGKTPSLNPYGAPYVLAAHVQAITNGGSDWVNLGTPQPQAQVPEPTTVIIWSLLGTIAFAVRYWRRLRAA
jgi:hypothetical protein